MATPNRRGADTERALARRLHGRRNGNRGAACQDVDAGWLAIEAKERKEIPLWLKAAVEQAVCAARVEQLPAVVVHQLGERHNGDLVVMRLCDFEQWHGRVRREGASE